MTNEETVTLGRPTGPRELELVAASGYRRWPPRLPGQPIFYPVLDEDYARKFARDWNVRDSGVGFVTRFSVRRRFLDSYQVQQVGGRTIRDYWIPAEDLDAFNDNIVGAIEVIAETGARSRRRSATSEAIWITRAGCHQRLALVDLGRYEEAVAASPSDQFLRCSARARAA